MLYRSNVLMTVKSDQESGFLGALEQSTLPLQNTGGVSLLLVLLGGAIGATAYNYWQLRKNRQHLK